MEYQVINLECWGNPRDGFHVNDAFTTGHRLEIPDSATDKEVIHILKEASLINPRAHFSSIELEGDSTIYVNDVRAKSGGFLPLYELRPVD